MPLEQVNIGTAENDPNADTLRAAFAKVNALVAATNQAQSDLAAMVEALAGKAAASHTHPYSEITDKPSVFPPAAHSHPWSDLTGVPTAFPPSAHQHTIGDVSGLQTALDGKMGATSFKTVNGTAITGAGDIVIPAGPAGTSITGVILTQAAYDALSTAAKNDTTKLYLIVG